MNDGCKPAPVPAWSWGDEGSPGQLSCIPRLWGCCATGMSPQPAGDRGAGSPHQHSPDSAELQPAAAWEATGWHGMGPLWFMSSPHHLLPSQDIQSGAGDSSHGSHKTLLLSFLWNKWYCFQKVIKTYARRECRELGY